MGFKIIKKFFLCVLFAAILLTFTIAQNNKAGAAGSASIYVSLPAGNFSVGQTFTTDIIIDGGGTAFNAAKANISLSKNLSIQDLTLGNCDFAFVVTPTVQNPSFVGVILGSFSAKCIVYKLTLKTTQEGVAYVILSNGSVKSYKKSLEILSSLRNGAYTINPVSRTQQPSSSTVMQNEPPEQNLQNQNDSAFYNVILRIKNDDGVPLKGATVILNPQDSSKIQTGTSYTQTSNFQGNVEFSDVQEGIYTIKTTYKNKKFTDNVLNVSGKNKTITLGLEAEKKTFDFKWFLFGLIPLTIILIIIIYKRRNR